MTHSVRDFHVGPLSFRLNLANGHLRSVRFHGHEAVRGIYPAVRDASWGTLPPHTSAPQITEASGRLQIHLGARVAAADVALDWTVTIAASANGELSYAWQARAGCAFQTNRTGLCVLHPAEAAGLPCTIEHTDGRVVAGWFPTAISPHQPFKDIRAVTHRFAPGAEAMVRMEGEVFEMEDQRNWTDASFKTYCRPLALPRPYAVAAGEQIAHTVRLTISGTPLPRAATAATLGLQPQPGRLAALPRIGFTLTQPLPGSLQARARTLRPAHVRVETTVANLESTLRWARQDADALGCALEIAVRDATRPPSAMPELRPGDTLMLFGQDGNTVDVPTLAAWAARTNAEVGTGTVNHFTELNRTRPPAAGPHTWVGFGLNAQVHAFDEESMLETITQHAEIARLAAMIGSPRAIAAGPVVLGPVADHNDPRLHEAFGAQWTLASLAELTRGGVGRVSFFRLHGPGGVLRDGGMSPLEQLFGLLAGATHAQPLALTGAGEQRLPVYSLLTSGAGVARRLLIAHVGEQPLEVAVPFAGEAGALGSGQAAPFTGGPVLLAPRCLWQLTLSP